MARILFFTILAMCLICVLQANPVTDESTTANYIHDLGTAFEKVGSDIQKGIQEFANDPHINKMFQGAKEFAENNANALLQQLDKMIPKKE